MKVSAFTNNQVQIISTFIEGHQCGKELRMGKLLRLSGVSSDEGKVALQELIEQGFVRYRVLKRKPFCTLYELRFKRVRARIQSHA